MAKFVINNDFLQQIELLELILRNNVAGRFGGTHQSKRFGSSCDFSDTREYMPGDNISKIDWNAYARFDRLYLKLYLDERQCHTKIYIDASKSMDYGKNKKAEKALQVACAFAYISICQMDKVSIYMLKNNEVISVCENMLGKENFYSNINKLNNIEFDGDCHISEALLPSNVGYGDGMSIIISDYLTDNDFERGIDYLTDKRRDVLCVQVMASEDMHPQIRGKVHFFDSEDLSKDYKKNINKDIINAYYAALNYSIERISNYCISRNAKYVMIEDTTPLNEFFLAKMPEMEVLE